VTERATHPASGTIPRQSLRQNSLWTFFGSLSVNGAKWVLFVLLTKVASPGVVGEFSLALAVATPISILAQLQLRVTFITDLTNGTPYGAYWALRVLTSCLALLTAAVLGLVGYGWGSTALLIVLVAASQAVESARDMWGGLPHKYERLDVTSLGDALDALLSTAFFAASLALGAGLHMAVAAMTAGRLTVLLTYDVPRARSLVRSREHTAFVWAPILLKRLLGVALPLGLTTFLVSLNSNLPRYFIEDVLGKQELAHFAAVGYLVLLAQLAVGSVGRAASPRLASLYHARGSAFVGLTVRLVGLGGAVGAAALLVAYLWGAPLLALVYTPDYAEASGVLLLLMVSAAIYFANSFLGVALSSARQFRVQTVVYLTVVVTTYLGCRLLVPAFGLPGAAYAQIISAGVAATLNGVALARAVVGRSRP
jgi:O-antigen/teichoic acid export membrane protein